MLGLPLAAIFAVMAAMWQEIREDERLLAQKSPRA
ncbi:cytochrome bd-I oxidase subunit CydX [Rhodobacter xanthinilyticus]|nr:cytochrome bd-I oxidase subunit CydX [Rhodobacter xanthinilyticus]